MIPPQGRGQSKGGIPSLKNEGTNGVKHKTHTNIEQSNTKNNQNPKKWNLTTGYTIKNSMPNK
ncbi:hypothetical protein [uncultured Methanobacterium sp.]|uniref:hypothetical protein n=1 Tax=uncultured Methanobacterium sp. TaxID=176306 RepID=UPI002AA62529|nr:hypothetical protein [uncultured Methanobacterium sp.]